MELLSLGSQAVSRGFGEWVAVPFTDPLSESIYRGFLVDLAPRRPYGMGPLPIPYPWFEEWMDRQGMEDPDLREEVKACLYALEEVELDYLRQLVKDQSKGNG